MERRLDSDLLARISQERHRLIRSGSFGQDYAAAIDAFRLAQNSNPSRLPVSDSPSVGYSGKDISYEMLE